MVPLYELESVIETVPELVLIELIVVLWGIAVLPRTYIPVTIEEIFVLLVLKYKTFVEGGAKTIVVPELIVPVMLAERVTVVDVTVRTVVEPGILEEPVTENPTNTPVVDEKVSVVPELTVTVVFILV